jgi:hypothetical protein
MAIARWMLFVWAGIVASHAAFPQNGVSERDQAILDELSKIQRPPAARTAYQAVLADRHRNADHTYVVLAEPADPEATYLAPDFILPTGDAPHTLELFGDAPVQLMSKAEFEALASNLRGLLGPEACEARMKAFRSLYPEALELLALSRIAVGKPGSAAVYAHNVLCPTAGFIYYLEQNGDGWRVTFSDFAWIA